MLETIQVNDDPEVLNQATPYKPGNLAITDPVLMADHYGSSLGPDERQDLLDFGALCGSPEMQEHGRLANLYLPVLHTHDNYGRRADVVEFHPSYHALMSAAFEGGVHCAAIDSKRDGTDNAQLNRWRKYYLLNQVEPGHVCPVGMTNAAVYPLRAEPALAAEWLPRIASRRYDKTFTHVRDKDGVTIGMGMTEKQAGSDLRTTITRATPAGDGTYRINGHKWFMSAPMCDAFLILADAPGGLTCFLLPRILDDGRVNGLHFQRLKNKMGNLANASSEVEFHDAVGFRVGAEGRGIPIILTMVNITRIDTNVASSGLQRAAMSRAVHHARERAAFGSPLYDQPLMISVLADMALDVAASTALAMRLAACMDKPEDDLIKTYLRTITPTGKFWTCKNTPRLIGEAMECLGGAGYVEDLDMPRLFREAPLNSIWEGSGNVMVLDLMRALNKEQGCLTPVLDMFESDMGETGREQAQEIHRAVARASEDRGSARFLCERLALTAAAHALKDTVPEAIYDAFVQTRLSGTAQSTYGRVDNRFDARTIVDWLYPQE